MKWIGFALVLAFMGFGTACSVAASTTGAGLPGLLEKPVSVRQSSVRHGRRGGVGPAFIYFSARRRRHFGGGYGYGK